MVSRLVVTTTREPIAAASHGRCEASQRAACRDTPRHDERSGKLAAFRRSHAHHHAQRQRHALRRAQGLRALARARRAVGRRVPAGDQVPASDVPRALARAAQVARVVPCRRSARATAASRSMRRRRRASRPGSVIPSSTPKGATWRPISPSCRSSASICPSGSSGPHRQASKYRFLDAFLPHLGELRRKRPRNRALRRLEHRAPADRPQELAQQPEELGLPAGGARVADARVRRSRASSTSSAASIRVPSSTRGGRIAGRRGRRTSAGGSTTRSPRPGSPPRRAPRRSTRNRRFSDHAPLIIDYDFVLR